MDYEQKKRFRKKIALIIYNLICNIPVCFFLCLASSLMSLSQWNEGTLVIEFSNISWIGFITNYVIAFVLAMCIGCFIPLSTIGRWFTSLFHVCNDTYRGNMKYRLLSTLIITLIYFSIISPTLAVINGLYYGYHITKIALSFLLQAPMMLIVGFVSSLLNDMIAYQAAFRIDNEF